MGAVVESPDLVVRGAREHNLKGVDVRIPKKALVVLTGVSGSGKTSLAFDTIYAEGNRRYVESLSAYARQFLGRMEKPVYESIRGLAPTIAIEQKTAGRNPRSTVGTITEIADYLRVAFARLGSPHCPECGRPVTRQSVEEMADALVARPEGTRLTLLAPLVRDRKGEHREVFRECERQGLVRVRVDGAIQPLEGALLEKGVDKKRRHSIEAVVDRLTVKAGLRTRLVDSLETALRLGQGIVIAAVEGPEGGGRVERSEHIYSERLACVPCGRSLPDLEPAAFSFNSPQGMCPACQGLGQRLAVDAGRVVADPDLGIGDGALRPWASAFAQRAGWVYRYAMAALKAHKIPLDVPWKRLPKTARDLLLHGKGAGEIAVPWNADKSKGVWRTTFRGLVPALEQRFFEARSESAKRRYGPYIVETTCPDCRGTRLRAESRSVQLGGKTLPDVSAMTITEAAAYLDALPLAGSKAKVARDLLREIRSRLTFLLDVGLSYLTLDRRGPTLSGGEAQRIRLASQVGTELTGVIYVLDEPSIGLHARDTSRLLRTLERLRDIGNTVLVVEHDLDTIRAADHVVDFGPGAGVRGGEVVVAGTVAEVEAHATSLTGGYLSGRLEIPLPERRREPGKAVLAIRSATKNNLRNVTVEFPLGCLVAVTGVSGAGKSTLVNQILIPALKAGLGPRAEAPTDPEEGPGALPGAAPDLGGATLDGLQHLDRAIVIDQQPIGRTPRSNPATYTKAFDPVRELFAQLPESRAFGYSASRFSFNVKGGRCEACQGDGLKQISMHFLPDVFVPCEVCLGKRFTEGTLRVRYRGLSIADVLGKSVDEAAELFAAHPNIARILGTLRDVGVGYLALGQPSPTLSGGEAQRIKLSRELAKRDTGRTLYVLDEPTVGLHAEDVRHLLLVLERLVAAGNTVIVIEHQLDVIKVADWVVDLGPEGGDGGGKVVAVGSPEAVASVEASHTGRALRAVLPGGFAGRGRSANPPSRRGTGSARTPAART